MSVARVAAWHDDRVDHKAILRLIQDIETDRVERKGSLSDPDRVCEAICAFANDLPGHRAAGFVAIGVDDSGQATGLTIDDKLLLQLSSFRDNGKIYPFPSMSVQRLLLDGSPIAVVVVPPSDSPPVQFRGRTWIRVGPRRAIATPEEEARLLERRRAAALPFDARPMPGATIGDLAVDRFHDELLPQLVAADVLAANRRSIEHQLASLRFIDPGGGGPYGLVDVATFGQPGLTDYRNPTLSGVLGQLGFVQRFGIGIEVARSVLKANGNPPLQLEVESTYVKAVVRPLP